jgi:hypothetical protein
MLKLMTMIEGWSKLINNIACVQAQLTKHQPSYLKFDPQIL